MIYLSNHQKQQRDARVEEFLNYSPVAKDEEARKKIEMRIKELEFALGYDYKVNATTLPQLEDAQDDIIYLNLSAYKSVFRFKNNLEKPVLSLQSGHDLVTLYVSLNEKTNNLRVSYLQNNLTTHSIVLDTKHGKDLENIVSLLPHEEQESLNPVLLRKLNMACYLPSDEDDNILLCSVRHYDGSYKTKYITAQDLKYAELVKNTKLENLAQAEKEAKLETLKNIAKTHKIKNHFFNPNEYKSIIIKMMVDAGYANLGVVGMKDDEQFLPDTYNVAQRKRLFRLLSAALALELSFTYLQYITAFPGWVAVIESIPVSMVFAIIGTIVDFIVNVWCISVANAADALALREITAPPSSMKYLINSINFASDISYLVGGAGNALGILAFMNPIYEKHGGPEVYYPLAILTVIATSVIGRAYYQAFLYKRLLETFTALHDFSLAEKADHDFFREAVITVFAFSVIAFRSIGFGGIAVLILTQLKIKDPMMHFIVGFLATVFTAINVIATRLKVIIDEWSNNDFAYLSNEKKNTAWKELKAFDILKNLLSTATLESLTMAVGFPCLTNFSNSMETYALSSVGATWVLFVVIAQIRKMINVSALEALQKDGINIKEQNKSVTKIASNEPAVTPDLPTNVVEAAKESDLTELLIPHAEQEDSIPLKTKANAGNLIFSTLSTSYKQSLAVILFAGVCSLISDVTRGLGFLGYIDIINSMLEVVVSIPVTNMQIIGVGLIIGPPNIRNMFNMFYSEILDNVSLKLVEANIANSNSNTSESTLCSQLSFYFNPISKNTLYTKGGLSYKIIEAKNHVEKEIETLSFKLQK